jgi:hypothetical protein
MVRWLRGERHQWNTGKVKVWVGEEGRARGVSYRAPMVSVNISGSFLKHHNHVGFKLPILQMRNRSGKK